MAPVIDFSPVVHQVQKTLIPVVFGLIFIGAVRIGVLVWMRKNGKSKKLADLISYLASAVAALAFFGWYAHYLSNMTKGG